MYICIFIYKYVNKGKIMLLGDFNARTYNICENIIYR